MAARKRAVLALIFITILVMLSSYSGELKWSVFFLQFISRLFIWWMGEVSWQNGLYLFLVMNWMSMQFKHWRVFGDEISPWWEALMSKSSGGATWKPLQSRWGGRNRRHHRPQLTSISLALIPRPAAISDYSTVDGLQVYISMVSNKPFDRSVPPSPVWWKCVKREARLLIIILDSEVIVLNMWNVFFKKIWSQMPKAISG